MGPFMTSSALSSRRPLLRRSLRRRVGLLAASSLVLPMIALVGATPASATNDPFFPKTSFAIDGDTYGPNDFDAPYGPGTTPAPGNYPTTGLYYVHRTIDMGGTTGCALAVDDAALGGTKIADGPLWPLGGPLPNGKTDIDFLDMAAEKVNVNGQINDILYVGYQKCGGEGTWQTMLYLDDGDGIPPSAGDQDGDYLFIFDFNPSDNSVTIIMHRRVAGVWAPQAMPPNSIEGFASSAPSNQDPDPDPEAGNYGEVAINLTTIGILAEDTCTSTTISGQSAAITGGDLNSAVKDLIDVTPVPISNCGALTVKKVSSPAGLTAADLFHYAVDQAPAKDAADLDVVHDSTLAVNLNSSGSSDEPDDDVMELDADITIGGTHNWTNVISQPDYTIAETTVPTPWTEKSITCTYNDIFTAGNPLTTVTIYENGEATGAEFAVPPTALATTTLPPAECTITNAATGLVLNKVVHNDSGGTATGSEFTLTATGPSTLSGVDPAPNDDATGLGAAVLPGTYTLSESASPLYYSLTGWTCVVTAADGTVGAPLVGVTEVTIPDMGGANCTATNEDPPSLAWTKIDSSTQAALGGTTWSLVGPTGTLEVVDCVAAAAADCTGLDVDPAAGKFLVLNLYQGTFHLTEVGAPAGYQVNTTTYDVVIADDTAHSIATAIPNVPTSVSWTKVGEDGEPLAGTTWTIQPAGEADPIEVQDCAAAPCAGPDMDPAAGAFLVYYLAAGDYTLTESAVPPGYYLDPTEHTFTVDASVQATIPVTEGDITNVLVRTTWQKIDEFNSEQLLGGSEWTLTGPAGEVIAVTDCVAATAADCAGPDVDPALGMFEVKGLTPGDWTLEETTAPVGYLIIADPITVTIDANNMVFAIGPIENSQNGQLAWVKKDDAGAILAGATFKICDVDPTGMCIEDIGDNTGQEGYEGDDEDPRPGYFLVTWLYFADWVVTETSAPDGYLLDTVAHTVTVGPSATPTDAGVFVNVKMVYGLTLTKAAYEGAALTDGVVEFGDTVTYELTATATGNSLQKSVTITDTLPVGTTYVADSATCLDEMAPCTATYDATTRTITLFSEALAAGDHVRLVFDVTVDAAPEVAPGSTYTWQGDNVGATFSTAVTTPVTSNTVTITASKTVLPATGSESAPVVLIGLLAILLGGGLVLITRRREKHTNR
jgi:uncharacterized repeat protein (TIGR01451 family)/LPXTG-motif cell wall-anchored protein